MTKKTRNHVDDLRGASRLAVEATKGVTDLVEAMHHTIAGGPDMLGRPLEGAARWLTAPVYGSIRAVTKVVGVALDLALAQLEPLLGESAPGVERQAVLAALNGVLGDYLYETKNPLAIEMRLHHDGHPIDLETAPADIPRATRKILVLVHGSCMSPHQWNWRGHDHGAALASDLGYTPIYVEYNSGLHISTNGRALDAMLERLALVWPEPIDEIAILAHSMGGLVSRSACHYAEIEKRTWRAKLRKMIFLGTPHHGALLERGGNWIDVLLGVSRYSAPLARLGQIRSAGVTDLRFGNVLEEHWAGRDRFDLESDTRVPVRLPDGVGCYAIAGSTSQRSAKNPLGDGLVSISSALGRHRDPALALDFSESNQWVGYELGHLQLLHRADVYEAIKAFLI